MLKKVILTAVLGAVMTSTSFLSFAQGVTWTGLFRASLQQLTKKETGNTGDASSVTSTTGPTYVKSIKDNSGKERTDSYIASYGEFHLRYRSQAVNGWYGVAQVGFRARKENNLDGTLPLTRDFYVGGGNESFEVRVGRAKFLDSVADMGGYVVATNVGTLDVYNANGTAKTTLGMTSLVDDGDLSSRDIGAIGVQSKGLPVLIKAGIAMQSTDKVYNSRRYNNPDGNYTDENGLKTTATTTQYGFLLKYATTEFSAGLQYLSTIKRDPAYSYYVNYGPNAGLTNIADATNPLKVKNDSDITIIALGANYDLKSSGVPLNVWFGIKKVDSKIKNQTVVPRLVTPATPPAYAEYTASVVESSGKDGKGGTQYNLGARFVFLPTSHVGFNYAATTFDKNEITTRLDGTKGDNKAATSTNYIVWVNLGTPWGSTAFATLSSTKYENSSTNVAEKRSDRSGSQIPTNPYFRKEFTVNSLDIGLNQTF